MRRLTAYSFLFLFTFAVPTMPTIEELFAGGNEVELELLLVSSYFEIQQFLIFETVGAILFDDLLFVDIEYIFDLAVLLTGKSLLTITMRTRFFIN